MINYPFLAIVEKLFGLILRLAGEVCAKLTEGCSVNLRENNGGMHLGVFQPGNSLKGSPCQGVIDRRNRERYKHLVGVKPWVVVAEILGLQLLNRLDDLG